MLRLFSLLVSVCLISWGASSCNATQKNQTDEVVFLNYNGDFHKDIIRPQVTALTEVAKVIYPRVCDDTETEWAAYQVDSLANVLLSNVSMPKGEQLARLYELENLTCYGMSYFSAIIGTYTNPEEAGESLSSVRRSHAFMDTLRTDGYRNAQLLNDFEQSVYFNFSGFMILSSGYSDGEPPFVTDNINMNKMNYACDNYLFKNLNNDTQAYRYSAYINNTTFFMTFCPLAFWIGGEEFQKDNQEEYMKIGSWFDEKTAPVISAIRNNTTDKLPELSTEEYSSFLKQSAEYRAKLLHFLAKAILTLKEG